MGKITNWEGLNDAHLGKDIFILGAGPSLGQLTNGQKDHLARRITVGTNLTQYVHIPTFFLSAYLGHCLMARSHVRREGVDEDMTIVQARVPRGPGGMSSPMAVAQAMDPVPGIMAVLRTQYGKAQNAAGEKLPRRLESPPILVTWRDAVFLQSHLAYILGARRIIYIGVEQNDTRHYYQGRNNITRLMALDADELALRYDALLHGPLANAREKSSMYVNRAKEPKALAGHGNPLDHVRPLNRFLRILTKAGVDVITTTRDSSLARAGARYLSVRDSLAGKFGTPVYPFQEDGSQFKIGSGVPVPQDAYLGTEDNT